MTDWKPQPGKPAMTRDEKTLVTDLVCYPHGAVYSKKFDCHWWNTGRLDERRAQGNDLVKPTDAILEAHGIDIDGNPVGETERIVWENNRFGHRTHFSDSTRFDEICELCGATDADGDNRLNKTCRGKPTSDIGFDPSLTSTEHDVINKLVAAWNAFVELPSEHPDDVTEFRHSLHALQLLILARPARRALFNMSDKTKE